VGRQIIPNRVEHGLIDASVFLVADDTTARVSYHEKLRDIEPGPKEPGSRGNKPCDIMNLAMISLWRRTNRFVRELPCNDMLWCLLPQLLLYNAPQLQRHQLEHLAR